jgi:hypothetical protein|nr:MAG TPA: capsid scaffolding protein [Caudoviricetes sp.]
MEGEAQNPDTSGTSDSGEERKFTQAELNAEISKRLARAKASQDKAIEEAVKQAVEDEREKQRIAGLDGLEKTKAEYDAKISKIEEANAKLQSQLAESNRNNAILRAQTALASQNLPVSFADKVIGANDEETAANIAELSKAFTAAVEAEVGKSLHRGTPPTGGQQASKSDAEGAELDRIMGIKR